LMYNPYKRFIK